MKTVYTKGDTFQYGNEDGEQVWQSGLSIPAISHYQAVVFYGATEKEAQDRRDEAFEAFATLPKNEAQMLRMATCAGEFARDAAKIGDTVAIEIDYEAIAWAYKKLLAYGVGNTNEEQALMLDRLNLMLLGQ